MDWTGIFIALAIVALFGSGTYYAMVRLGVRDSDRQLRVVTLLALANLGLGMLTLVVAVRIASSRS